MQCPVTSFDCITCDEKCVLVERASSVSCNGHERIYEDGSGYICRHCGADMDDDED